jgi:hypothetical protein
MSTDARVEIGFTNFVPEGISMPRGRRPKVAAAPKKFERQEALKERIIALPAELRSLGSKYFQTPPAPITPIAPGVVDEKIGAKIAHVEEPLAVYLQRTSVKENVSQRPPFDHIRDPIYRRLMRDFLQGAQMPEAKVAALRRSDVGKVESLAENDILYSLIDGLQRLWCFSTCVLLVLHREKLIPERCISAEDWTYFKPFVDALGPANEATETILGRIVRYEIFYEIDLEGLLHFLVTFNTGQRRMSLQVQLEIMHKPLIDEIEKTAGIQVFRDTRDLEGHAGTQKPKGQFAASELAVATQAFITNNPQAAQKEIAEDMLEKELQYTALAFDIGDITDVVSTLRRVANEIHPQMLEVYADEPGKMFYFSGGGTFLIGFSAACGYIRNRNNMKMLEAALDKLVSLLKHGGDDPLSLVEYQEAISTITSSRGKMMRRLVYDSFLRYFLGTTTRLEWIDAAHSLTLT